MNTWFFGEVKKRIQKIRKAIRFYREFCKVKATKFHKEKYELMQNLECTQNSL
jgi:hypothetical protein